MLKKVFFMFFLVFLIVSCGEETVLDGLTDYSSNGFTIRIPEKWERLKNDTNILPKPSAGDLELVTSSKIKLDGLYNSFIILSEDLDSDIDSIDYSRLNNLAQKQNYHYYKEISSDEINFGNDKNLNSSKIYVFDAKYNEDVGKIRFLQTGFVCGKKGYILTLSIPTSIDNILKYEYIFSTFNCSH